MYLASELLDLIFFGGMLIAGGFFVIAILLALAKCCRP